METYQNLSDRELFLLLKKSDHSAYTEIYHRYSHVMIRTAYGKLNDEARARDVTQELFAYIWENRLKLGEISNPGGYLNTALKNRILNFFEHQHVESKYIDSLTIYANTGNIANTDYLIREKDQLAAIDKAYEALSPRMRQIFELSRNQQLPHKEIAKKLSTSEENVAKQITTALKILRTKLSSIVLFF
jgi:RNA polymerase sigma-70 factor (family 1)